MREAKVLYIPSVFASADATAGRPVPILFVGSSELSRVGACSWSKDVYPSCAQIPRPCRAFSSPW